VAFSSESAFITVAAGVCDVGGGAALRVNPNFVDRSVMFFPELFSQFKFDDRQQGARFKKRKNVQLHEVFFYVEAANSSLTWHQPPQSHRASQHHDGVAGGFAVMAQIHQTRQQPRAAAGGAPSRQAPPRHALQRAPPQQLDHCAGQQADAQRGCQQIQQVPQGVKGAHLMIGLFLVTTQVT
jgi:hypothetical protein